MHTELTLSDADADLALRAVRDALKAAGKVGVIAVADAHGELLALARLDGTRLPSITIATNKAWTAARERKPTSEIGKRVRDAKAGFDIAYFGDPRYLGWGGGVPVTVESVVVGSVAVSGLSEEEDAAFAQLGVDAILAARK